MSTKPLSLPFASAALLGLTLSNVPGQNVPTTIRLSETMTATEGNGHSVVPRISRDTRFTVFASLATNLVPNDNNLKRDVFLKDRFSGAISRLSVSFAGGDTDGGSGSRFGFEGSYLSISSTGRHVAFWSDATNIVPGDKNRVADIFVRDVARQKSTRVSIKTDGGESSAAAAHCAISGSGRFVAFVCDGLTKTDKNNAPDIYVHDRDTDGNGVFDEPGRIKTTLVSVSSANVQANDGSDAAWISPSGRFVTFRSKATNLVAGDNNTVQDWFVRDLVLGKTVRVNVSSSGKEDDIGAASFSSATTSDDGRHVVFGSGGTTLVANDKNGKLDVFVRDRDPDGNGIFDENNGRTVRVSVRADGSEVSGISEEGAISPDGRFVAYGGADHLLGGDNNNSRDIILYDRDADGNGVFDESGPGKFAVEVLSLTPAGRFPARNSGSYAPHFAGDSGYVAFHSYATDLVGSDNNGVRDIFLRKRFGLRLTSDRTSARTRDLVQFTIWDGEPTRPAGLFLESVNQSPLSGPSFLLGAGALNARGRINFAVLVPTIPSTVFSAGFRALTLDTRGRVVGSNGREVALR